MVLLKNKWYKIYKIDRRGRGSKNRIQGRTKIKLLVSIGLLKPIAGSFFPPHNTKHTFLIQLIYPVRSIRRVEQITQQ